MALNKVYPGLLVVVLSSLVCGSASAEDAPDELAITPLDLAVRVIKLGKPNGLTDGDKHVTIDVSGGAATPCDLRIAGGQVLEGGKGPTDCPALWGMEHPTRFVLRIDKMEFPVRLAIGRPVFGGEVKVGRIQRGGVRNAAVLGLVWVSGNLAGDVINPIDPTGKEIQYLKDAQLLRQAYAEQDDKGGLFEVKQPSGDYQLAPDADDREAWPDRRADVDETEPCRYSNAYDEHLEKLQVEVEAQVSTKGNVEITSRPKGGVISANRIIGLRVLHPRDGFVLAATLGNADNAVGLTSPAIQLPKAPSQGSLQAFEGQAEEEQSPFTRTCYEFAPRKPGAYKLEVTTHPPTTEEVKDGVKRIATAELIVEQPYLGAIRLGSGLVFGDAVGRSFEAKSLSPGAQPEIVEDRKGAPDPELVVGFSIYPEAFLPDWMGDFGAGRTYSDWSHVSFDSSYGCKPSCLGYFTWEQFVRHSGAYLGVGLLGATENISDGFQSFYVGYEYELAQNFSIAIGATLRSVEKLNGVRVGDAVTDKGSIPTRHEFEWGPAVVVNVTSEFFKFATQPGFLEAVKQ